MKGTASVPRSLFEASAFLDLSPDAQHYLLRLYCTCDGWGRFGVGEQSLAARVCMPEEQWEDILSDLALAGLVILYSVAGFRYGQLVDYDDCIDSRARKRRNASIFPHPQDAALRFDDHEDIYRVPDNYGLRKAVKAVASSVIERTDAVPILVAGVVDRLKRGYSVEALARAMLLTLGDTPTDEPTVGFWPRVESLYAVEVTLLKKTSSVTDDEESTVQEVIGAIANKRYRQPTYGSESFSHEQHNMNVEAELGDELRRLAVVNRPHFIALARVFVDTGLDAHKGDPHAYQATDPLRKALAGKAKLSRSQGRGRRRR